jgi:hypothetical protein
MRLWVVCMGFQYELLTRKTRKVMPFWVLVTKITLLAGGIQISPKIHTWAESTHFCFHESILGVNRWFEVQSATSAAVIPPNRWFGQHRPRWAPNLPRADVADHMCHVSVSRITCWCGSSRGVDSAIVTKNLRWFDKLFDTLCQFACLPKKWDLDF